VCALFFFTTFVTAAWLLLPAQSDEDGPASIRGHHRDDGTQKSAPSDDPWSPAFARICRGDSGAFDELYLALYPSLVLFAAQYVNARAIAEEVVQDTFLALWDRRADIGIRTTVREYLFGAVRNRALKVLRHDRVVEAATTRLGIDAVAGVAQPQALPDARVADAELHDALERALNAMPPERRQVLTLRWREEMSYPEIAAILGISEAAAKQHGSRAQRALRAVFQQHRL